MVKVLNSKEPKEQSIRDHRFERKFVFEEQNLEDLIQSNIYNSSFLFEEIYNRRTINNIYFDDNDHSFYKMNVSGVGRRDKYRLRWYGDQYALVNKPTFEIKRKWGEVGDKLLYKLPDLEFDITKCTTAEVYDKVINWIKDPKLLSEVQRLNPLLYNSYERRYFLSEDEKFRITIDYNMRFYNPNVDQFQLSEISISDIVLELKYKLEDDLLGRKLAQEIKQRLSKNSKYVRGYDLINFNPYN